MPIISTQGMAGNINDVNEGKKLLSIYFSLLRGKPSPFKSLTDVIEYYSTDKELKAKGEPYERWHHTDTLETFGYYTRILNNPSKLKKSLLKLANATTEDKAPSAYAFGKVIANEADSISVETVKEISQKVTEGVKQGVTTIVKTATFGAGAYIAFVALAALIGFAYKMKTQSAILKALRK